MTQATGLAAEETTRQPLSRLMLSRLRAWTVGAGQQMGALQQNVHVF